MSDTGDLRLAAASIPIRDSGNGLEILMVRRNENLSFGGLWTFPGGTLDASDGAQPSPPIAESTDWADPALLETATTAAIRETREETNLVCDRSAMTWFSHWVPPAFGAPKRFATWFFIARNVSGEMIVDTSENSEARWVKPTAALADWDAGDFPLAVPTWVTLDDLAGLPTARSVHGAADDEGPRMHHTRAFRVGDERLLCWAGDAAYATGDPDLDGPRNRVLADSSMTNFLRVRRG
ncbi:MAG: NUDIX hydrolase [Acidimicrobiales bacterium]